jgi:hypothetical protein
MAIWTPSPAINEIRNKLGSNVFSKNHYGPVVRKYVIPIDPGTPKQLSQRSNLKNISKSWGLLQQSQITAWNVLAADIERSNSLGQKSCLTGEARYISNNLDIISAGGSIISDCPSIASNFVRNLDNVVITIVAGVISMSFARGLAATNIVELKSSAALSGGINYNSQYKILGTFASTSSSPQLLTAMFALVYPAAPVAGNVVFFKIRVIDKLTGFSSRDFITRVVSS